MEERILNDTIIATAKKYIHSQTGYIHYCYHQKNCNYDVTIPTYENFLYVYALLKSKIVDNIHEAKELLDSLLNFQNKENKNFPLYLHEYPKCSNHSLPFKILPIFIFIQKQFSSILGENLLNKLKVATLSLMELGFEFFQKKYLKIEEILILTAGALTLNKRGNLLNFETNELLKSISFNDLENASFLVQNLGEILTAFQVSSELSTKFSFNFLKFFSPSLGIYSGPALQISQEGYEPEVTLYDFHSASISGIYTSRILKEKISILQACLVQPYKNQLECKNVIRLSRDFKNIPWNYLRTSEFSVSSIDMPLDKENPHWKTIAPFYLTWGDLSFVHSLIYQGGNYQSIKTFLNDKTITIQIELSHEFDLEDKEKKNEVNFYLTKHPETLILINDQKATTFKLQDLIYITTQKLKLKIHFKTLEGDAQFLGHIMPGNRPCQINDLKKDNYFAYDWQIILRTLRRSSQKNLLEIKIDVL